MKRMTNSLLLLVLMVLVAACYPGYHCPPGHVKNGKCWTPEHHEEGYHENKKHGKHRD